MLHLTDFPPMLVTSQPVDFNESDWIYEIMYDGYRMTAEFDGLVQLRTRNGSDATKWFPEITHALGKVKGGQYIVDGEMCVFDQRGHTDFGQLQGRVQRRRWYEGAAPVVYCVFDLLVNRGVDISQQPLLQRKAALAKLFKPARPGILVVKHFDDSPRKIFSGAVSALKLDTLVAKRVGSVYRPGVRSLDWVKVSRDGIVPPTE